MLIDIQEACRHSQRFSASRFSDLSVERVIGLHLHSGDHHARGGPKAPMAQAVISPTRQAAIWAVRDRLLDPDCRFTELAEYVYSIPDL